MENYLLSICIPTFNRARYLKQCLNSIIIQKGFEEIEVVISDNYSTDGTQEIGNEYSKKYSNIRYFRNDKNVADMNFSLVFQRAKGSLRKLTNDTVVYKAGAIKYMLDIAKENIDRKPQVYFLSNGDNRNEGMVVSSLDDYITALGHNLTWIRSIAIWDEDCNDLSELVNNANTRLGQVPFLLKNFEKHGSAVIFNRNIMEAHDIEKKNLSYGLYKVFYETFLGFVKPYVEKGKISKNTYEYLRKDLLLNFFCHWIIYKELDSDKYIFSDEDLSKLVEEAYKNEQYFEEYKRKQKKIRNIRRIKKNIKQFLR